MRALVLLAVAAAAALPAQSPAKQPPTKQPSAGHHHPQPLGDSAFAALQARGKNHMGVDQYASTHRFDVLPDGGRIALQSDRGDSAAVAAIRAHMRTIAAAFARGDFATPGLVHAKSVPGTRVMAAKRAAIVYEPRDLPRGAEVRVRTRDAEALRAVAEFMAFQRAEHRAGGHGR
jgi:hypothetical protein